MTAFGRAIRERREELGLLQRDLAELAGCSTRFVHTLERGKPSVRLDKVLDVLHVLGLDLVVSPGRGRLRAPVGSDLRDAGVSGPRWAPKPAREAGT